MVSDFYQVNATSFEGSITRSVRRSCGVPVPSYVRVRKSERYGSINSREPRQTIRTPLCPSHQRQKSSLSSIFLRSQRNSLSCFHGFSIEATQRAERKAPRVFLTCNSMI